MHNHNHPQDLRWSNSAAAAAAAERASQHQRSRSVPQHPWEVPPPQQPPPHHHLQHPPPHHLPGMAHHPPGEHPPPYIPPVMEQNVISIDDSDSDDNHAVSRRKNKKKKKDEPVAKARKNTKKRSSSETNEGRTTKRQGTGNRRHPVAARSEPVAPSAVGGVFVSGVLTGRLLETEREANQQRAFSNIIMSATGNDMRAIDNPPPHIHLSLEQVRTLGNGFLEDRNHAVREAVRIAHTEMKQKLNEAVRTHTESLQEEITRRHEAESVLKTVNNEANNHVAERIRLSAENVQLREQLGTQTNVQATGQHVIRLSAENADLKAKLEAQAREKDDEIEYLRNHLSPPTPSRKKKSKDEDALLEEVASLKAEIEYLKKRQARSIGAFKDASVLQLRLLQSQRDANLL